MTANKEAGQSERAVEFVHSSGFPAFLRSLGVSLAVTTYQAQRLMTISPAGEKLSLLMRVFERPTGLAIEGKRMALVTKRQIWLFQTAELRDGDGKPHLHDACYVPRMSFVTGDISGHEIGWMNGTLVAVNTRFSCLCTVTPDASFKPVWKPPFISEYAPEDRCHLSGMAVSPRGIHFITALGETDSEEGWRQNKIYGGIIIDAATGRICARGLSMPHSPRVYNGALWVLDSGTGQLQTVDPETGVRHSICALPGYLRGLAFYGHYAFVGLCKIRESSTFGGLPVQERSGELECAVYAVDIRSGAVAHRLRFAKGVEELFDIQVLPEILNPHIVGFEEDTIDGVFILP